jgi:hypothetical protein
VGRGAENCEVDGESGVSGLAVLRCSNATARPHYASGFSAMQT